MDDSMKMDMSVKNVDLNHAKVQNIADRPLFECRLLNLFLPLKESASLG